MSEETTNITFIQNHVPALEAGEYRIETTQTVSTNLQTQATYTGQQSFYVSGKRYSLEAGDVNSVFPPLGSEGLYDRVLPHVVLESSSLPWQRSTGYTGEFNYGNQAPWLALLMFDESENVGAPVQVTLGDLVTYNSTFFPPRTEEPGESDSDPVNVIDIPLNLFNQICPSIIDLQWLAHVRNVSVENKSTSNDSAANDTYAVVIANRLPATDRVSTMHLVSLENYSDYLPSYQNQSVNMPVGISQVRLVTLYSWSFKTIPQLQSFGGLLVNADMNPPVLQMPFTNDADGTSDANTAVQNAFGMGYTAMNHQLRNGDQTVSWYRGPLLPLGLPSFLIPPYQNADQLMRYDPTIGMLDATYASAWQLGKLMALHDNSYAQTLVRWKAKQTESVVRALEDAILDEALNIPQNDQLTVSSKKSARMNAAIKNIVGPAVQKNNSDSNA